MKTTTSINGLRHTPALLGLTIVALASIPNLPARAHIGHWLPVSNNNPRTVAANDLKTAEQTATHGTISGDKKTLTFTEKAITFVVETGPDDDMLSYRIAGLRNPTVVLPRGAVVTVLFVNRDGDMTHDLRFTAAHAPFPMEPNRKDSVGSATLVHADKSVQHAEQFTMRAEKAGDYAYLCTVKGHAKGGMFGVLQVK